MWIRIRRSATLCSRAPFRPPRRSSALLAARARNKAVSAAIAYAVPRRSARGHCAAAVAVGPS